MYDFARFKYMRNKPMEQSKMQYRDSLSLVYLKSHLSIAQNRISLCPSKGLIKCSKALDLCEFYLINTKILYKNRYFIPYTNCLKSLRV